MPYIQKIYAPLTGSAVIKLYTTVQLKISKLLEMLPLFVSSFQLSCGLTSGQRKRRPRCVRAIDGQLVSNSRCDQRTRPSSVTEDCNVSCRLRLVTQTIWKNCDVHRQFIVVTSFYHVNKILDLFIIIHWNMLCVLVLSVGTRKT